MAQANRKTQVAMNGTPAAKARRNLAKTSDRAEWGQAHSEDHPLHYRLHGQNGAYNFKGDRMALLAEIHESKPERIERIFPKDSVQHFASIPAHQHLISNIELVELPA
jgi:hypothetical protein